MSGRRPPLKITRRTALGSAALAGTSLLLSPPAGLGGVVKADPAIFSRAVGSLSGESPELDPGRSFALVGLQWAGPAEARIELRARGRGGDWSRWTVASIRGHGPDWQRAAGPLFGEPIWLGDSELVQLRSSGPVYGVTLHFVADEDAGAATAGLPLAGPVLPAGPGQPPIIARAAWAQGARPAVAPSYGLVKLAFVHHTENPNGYGRGEVPAMLRSIFAYHRYVRGWEDIGYNFVIDAFGRIWEARAGGIDEAVIGAQAGGYNAVSTGVALLGSFMTAVPPAAAVAALERLLAWKLSLHGVPVGGRVTVVVDPADAFYTPFAPGAHVSLPRVAGHRDGDSTDCPGNALYARLPEVRRRVATLAGTPAVLTLARATAVASAGVPIELSGHLVRLGGAPLSGASVEVQRVSAAGASTIATATTAADGSWRAAVELWHGVLLRALHRRAPAAVSAATPVTVKADAPAGRTPAFRQV